MEEGEEGKEEEREEEGEEEGEKGNEEHKVKEEERKGKEGRGREVRVTWTSMRNRIKKKSVKRNITRRGRSGKGDVRRGVDFVKRSVLHLGQTRSTYLNRQHLRPPYEHSYELPNH